MVRDLREVLTDKMSGLEGEMPAESADRNVANVLNPITDAIGCKRCVSKVNVIAATAGRTAYDLPSKALLDLILKAQ